jgi:hypothetical protein
VEGRKNNVRKAMLQKENDKRRMKWEKRKIKGAKAGKEINKSWRNQEKE